MYRQQVHSLYRIQADDAEQFVSVGAVATGTVGLTRWLVVLRFLSDDCLVSIPRADFIILVPCPSLLG